MVAITKLEKGNFSINGGSYGNGTRKLLYRLPNYGPGNMLSNVAAVRTLATDRFIIHRYPGAHVDLVPVDPYREINWLLDSVQTHNSELRIWIRILTIYQRFKEIS
jgi:hypothetical protein